MTTRLNKKFNHQSTAVVIAACLLTVLTSLTACEQVSCPLNNTVESVYGFYASARTADGTFAEGAAVKIADTLTVTILGRDTVLLNRIYNQSSISLPVSYYADTDTLLFTFTDKQGAIGKDTLWMHKENTAHFDDPSCPVHIWHTVTGVESTRHIIDTIIVNNADINYDGLENFQIYFHISTDQDTTDDED